MSLTRSKVKSRPSMYAAPPNIACRTVGAISSSSSRKMAIEFRSPRDTSRQLAELLGAFGVELDVYDGQPRALVLARIGPLEVLAG